MNFQELGIRAPNLLTIRKLLSLNDPLENEISVLVQPMSYGHFGVYANRVLIAIYPNHTAANAYCLRLRKQLDQE